MPLPPKRWSRCIRSRKKPAVGNPLWDRSICFSASWAPTHPTSSDRYRYTGEAGEELKSPQTTNGSPLAWVWTKLASFVQAHANGDPFVVGGDFNSSPASPVYRYLSEEVGWIGAQESLKQINRFPR